MNRPVPILTTDEDAERFVDSADLGTYDLAAFRPHSFEFAAKSAQVNMRFSAALLAAVRERAAGQGISYQRFIRQTPEAALRKPR